MAQELELVEIFLDVHQEELYQDQEELRHVLLEALFQDQEEQQHVHRVVRLPDLLEETQQDHQEVMFLDLQEVQQLDLLEALRVLQEA